MLYLKVAELLSAGLQTAIDQIRAGKLCLSSTVKQGAWARAPGSRGAGQGGRVGGRVARSRERPVGQRGAGPGWRNGARPWGAGPQR